MHTRAPVSAFGFFWSCIGLKVHSQTYARMRFPRIHIHPPAGYMHTRSTDTHAHLSVPSRKLPYEGSLADMRAHTYTPLLGICTHAHLSVPSVFLLARLFFKYRFWFFNIRGSALLYMLQRIGWYLKVCPAYARFNVLRAQCLSCCFYKEGLDIYTRVRAHTHTPEGIRTHTHTRIYNITIECERLSRLYWLFHFIL